MYFKPFSSIVLKKFYIEDLDQDTLLYVDDFSARLDFRSIRDLKIIMNKAELTSGKFSLKKYKDSTTNLTFIQNYFKSSGEKSAERKGIDFTFPDLAFENMDLKYRDYSEEEVDYGINYGDIHLSSFSGTLKEIDFKNYIFKADVQNLAFKEKSGLVVKD